MGDSIIYKLKSGKPNKFLNFLSGFAIEYLMIKLNYLLFFYPKTL